MQQDFVIPAFLSGSLAPLFSGLWAVLGLAATVGLLCAAGALLVARRH